jgi:hypothetical protein
MKLRCTQAAIVLLIICVHLPSIQSQQAPRGLKGRVVDEQGVGIEGVTIVASGAGFSGWATTNNDGSFQLPTAGAFITFRHPAFKPRLIPTSELVQQAVLRLHKADDTIWRVPHCASLPNRGRGWVGSGLRVNAAKMHHKGPIYGEHDSHWYFKHNHYSLHIVDGYAWHSGLPVESILTESASIRIRGWVYDDIVGVDLSGQTRSGSRWRWVGAPVALAIEYNNVSQEAADYFDKIIETMCFGSP